MSAFSVFRMIFPETSAFLRLENHTEASNNHDQIFISINLIILCKHVISSRYFSLVHK